MISIHDLPAVNAALNSLCSVFLVYGFVMIRRGRVTAHRRAMIAATITSVLFLVSYLTYHFHTGSTRFQTPGAVRTVYLSILLVHTVLAAVMGPMILVTLYRAFKNQVDRHRRLARWTWPIWITVSVTGVVIYWMLYRVSW